MNAELRYVTGILCNKRREIESVFPSDQGQFAELLRRSQQPREILQGQVAPKILQLGVNATTNRMLISWRTIRLEIAAIVESEIQFRTVRFVSEQSNAATTERLKSGHRG